MGDASECKKNETAISWNEKGDGIRTIARADGFATDEGDPSDLGAGDAPTQLLSRVLSFTKTEDDTGIRVSYTDNRGCYGIGAPNAGNIGCQWEIRFNGTRCIDPSNLAYAYYSDHTGIGGNLIFNRSETVVGTCFATGALGLPADDYEIQVWIAKVPGYVAGNFNTGFKSYWALEAEEVN